MVYTFIKPHIVHRGLTDVVFLTLYKSKNEMCEKLSARNNSEDTCYQIFQRI